ncbi:uncharacterized protein LOC135690297 [Rhopilema esculentum]|uniref:uncharacterized protein LOC135690297 n=1 Tax=Rhopilema esculentum TaxID=499914 RepID=UPI0031DC07F7
MGDKLPSGSNQEVPLLDNGTPKSVVPLGDNGTVQLSKDSDPSLVPCTPEFSNSSFCHDQNKVTKEDLPSEPLPEDPLTDLKRAHGTTRTLSQNSKTPAASVKALETPGPRNIFNLLNSQLGEPAKQGTKQTIDPSATLPFAEGTAKIVTRKGHSFLQVVKPVGILVPKNNDSSLANAQNCIKVWTGDLVAPLSISGANFDFNLEPVDVPKTDNDAVVPNSVGHSVGSYTKIDTNAPSTSRENTGSTETKVDRNECDDNMKYYRFMNLDRNLVVKATKFKLNGEECYLIPAKLALKHNLKKPYSQAKVGGSKDGVPSSQSGTNAALLSGDERFGTKGVTEGTSRMHCEDDRDGIHRLRVASIFRSKGDATRYANGRFLRRSAADVVQKGYHWYPDVPMTFGTNSYNGMRLPDQCWQAPDTYLHKQTEHRDARCHYHPSIRCHKVVSPENAMLHISKLKTGGGCSDKTSEDKMRVGTLQCQNSKLRAKDTFASKFKGSTKFDSAHSLHYVLECSQAGTMIFGKGRLTKETNIVEPPLVAGLTFRRCKKTKDQVVPDLGMQAIGDGQYNSQNDRSAKYRPVWSKTNEEIAFLLREVQQLTRAPIEADETQLIMTACNTIMNMEIGIRGLMSQLGYNLRSTAQLDQQEKITEGPDPVFEATNLFKESEFLVPQSPSIRRKLREDRSCVGKLPEVPNWDRSTSPELKITKDTNWSPSEIQASFPQGRSRGSMPMSSQLSFSDSLTDDSENMHEFDLYFEKEANSKEEQGNTFQTYVNDVFNTLEVGGLESCGKASPAIAGQERSATNPIFSPERFVFSPSLDHLSFSAQSSPVIETPQTFSVNCLDYDIENQASPRWYQTVDHGLASSDASPLQSMAGNLSMKVLKKNRMTKEKKKEEKQNKKINDKNKDYDYITSDDERWIGRSEEDRLAAELLSTLCEIDDRREESKSPAKIAVKEPAFGEDEDTKALKHLESIALLGKSNLDNPKTILAKDLVESDLLASFLYPKPSFIPEDPFGIGAETVIGRSLEVPSTKELGIDQVCEETPTQSSLGFTQLPPVAESKGGRKRVFGVEEPIARKRPNRLRYMESLCDETTSPVQSSCTEHSDELPVFIPQLRRRRRRDSNIHQHRQPVREKTNRYSRNERKHENVPNRTQDENIAKKRTRISRRTFQRRRALKLVN